MAYDCKVYDQNGKLKKVVKGNKSFTGATKILLKQKSTKRAVSYIKTMRDPKIDIKDKVRFYDNECVVCKMVFHPRQRQAKYCSYECQHKFYKENKIREKIRLVNAGKNI
tara:strand:- start:2 stop:331 length:330 start_codon:yes stop_codon:yes gene_type:complete